MHAKSDPKLTGADLRVLPAVLDRMNARMECWPGYGRIANDTGLTRRTAARSIERLISLGYLEKESRGTCVSNLYRLGKLSTGLTIDTPDDSDSPDDSASDTPDHSTVDGADYPLLTGMSPELASKNQNSEPAPLNPPSADGLPVWFPVDAWESFESHRKQLKAPMTDQARKLNITALKKLKEQGHDPQAVIEQSIRNGWKGLFELKTQTRGTATEARLDRDTEETAADINNQSAKRAEGWTSNA